MEFEGMQVQIFVFSATSASAWKLKNNKLDIFFSIDTFNVWAIVIRILRK